MRATQLSRCLAVLLGIASAGCGPLLEPSFAGIDGPGDALAPRPSPYAHLPFSPALKPSPYEEGPEVRGGIPLELPACCVEVVSSSSCGGRVAILSPWGSRIEMAGADPPQAPPLYKETPPRLALKPSPYEDAPPAAGMVEVRFTGCCAGVVLLPATCAGAP